MRKNTIVLKFAKLSIVALLLIGLVGCSNTAAHPSGATASGSSVEEVFNSLCKTSGEKIYRTVENIDGVFLMKLRPSYPDLSDKYKIYDPYGNDLMGNGYIISFLKNHNQTSSSDKVSTGPLAYAFVEAVDPSDNRLYRYTGRIKATGLLDINAPAVQAYLKKDPNADMNIYRYVLQREPITNRSARYGVNYSEISTKSHRDLWIAGSLLQIVDLETDEILAERIGYMRDPGMGARAGGRTPWLIASKHACPSFGPDGLGHRNQAVNFTKKSLKPIPD